ncbi:MAG: PAS domain S-box protein [Spirochaetes bacterium]|nr:PAS domain S-box protein [Spirochaetota bacterium]
MDAKGIERPGSARRGDVDPVASGGGTMQDNNGSIVNLLPDIIYRIDEDGNFTYLNRAVRCLGYEPEELLSRHFSTIIHPEDLENIQRSHALKKMGNGDGGSSKTPKLFDERRTGKRITRNLSVRLVPKESAVMPEMDEMLRSTFEVMSIGSYENMLDKKKRKFRGTLGVIRPAAVKEDSTESMERSVQYYRTLVENASDVVSLMATDGTILFASPSVMRLLGYDPAEFAGTGIWDYIHPDDARIAEEQITGASAIDPEFEFDCRVRDAEGAWRVMLSNGRMVFDGSGESLCMMMKSRDITAQRESEASLQRAFEYMEHRVLDRTADLVRVNNRLKAEIENRKKEEAKFSESDSKYRNLVNSIDDIVFNIDSDGVILYVNQSVEKVAGHDPREIIGHNILAHVHPDDADGMADAFEKAALRAGAEPAADGGSIDCHECRMMRKDGSTVWIEMRFRPVMDAEGAVQGYRGIAVDITRRKKSEEELLRASKIETMGILAGGLAHDFNNLLTSILGCIALVKRGLEDEPGNEEKIHSLGCAESASRAARDLALQLLEFAKGGAPVIKSTSIRSLLMDTASFVLNGSPVRCVFSVPEKLCDAAIDRGQISQVIHNIVLNARQSMPSGGTISIAAEEVQVRPESEVPLRPGKYIMISIVDSGKGIPSDIMQNIFDPYFTTKESGTGLGLSISYTIIKKHGGYIAVKSEEGVGSIFTIYVPASKKRPGRGRGKNQERSKKGRVLFADDDRAILSVGERFIRSLGYEVVCVDGAKHALDRYAAARERGEPFDIVIIDMFMPGEQPIQRTIEEFKTIDPGARVIVTSGYVKDPIMTECGRYGFSGSLAKPFSLEELEEELARVLRL